MLMKSLKSYPEPFSKIVLFFGVHTDFLYSY